MTNASLSVAASSLLDSPICRRLSGSDSDQIDLGKQANRGVTFGVPIAKVKVCPQEVEDEQGMYLDPMRLHTMRLHRMHPLNQFVHPLNQHLDPMHPLNQFDHLCCTHLHQNRYMKLRHKFHTRILLAHIATLMVLQACVDLKLGSSLLDFECHFNKAIEKKM
ncbi:uncharacterized protein LOC114270931 [Camellia sinensis]|uniref:uncharacterized protein LOC114270931 n=1 Tax=Camellia sinensis TaxID=4442 RepID=UPI00103653EE|nr:uncharacterized protein LOC114270931 [Camellia sinensis]